MFLYEIPYVDEYHSIVPCSYFIVVVVAQSLIMFFGGIFKHNIYVPLDTLKAQGVIFSKPC